MPSISIIIPTFNRAPVLTRAICSAAEQTYIDCEIIVVDDASTDGTDLDKLVPDIASRITYIQLPVHRGVSAARNTGAHNAKGQWLAFLDSDDQWHADKLSRQMQWHKENPDFIISQAKEIWIRNGVRVNPPKTHEKKQGDIFAQSLERCMITPSSVLIARDLFFNAGMFNESLPACEDYDLWLKITCRQKVGLIDEFLLTRYGGHDDQLSSTVAGLDRFRIRSIMDVIGSNRLTSDQENLARAELVKKSTIFANGCKKRGKLAEYERFRNIAELFSRA